MKTQKFLVSVLFAGLLTVYPLYAAEDHHDHGKMSDHSMGSSMNHDNHGSGMKDMFLVKKNIDGYDVSFHVMDAQKGMEHGGSQNLMVKIEQNGKMLKDVSINSKVVSPNGEAKSKMLMRMGSWYINGYDLDQEGQYQVMVLFKTADGKKHKGGVYYPAK